MSIDVFSGVEDNNNDCENHLPWIEKYRPNTIDDLILPTKMKTMFNFAIQNNEFTHFCFHSGKPGTGKTSTAIAIAKTMNTDYLMIFISEKAIESLETIRNYAAQKNVDGKPRFVILDEADSPRIQNPKSFYNALQPLIESSTSTLRFILTCNNLYNIPSPMLSRCTPVSFAYDPNDVVVKTELYKKMCEIANNEVINKGGKVDKNTLGAIAKYYYPDIRSIIQCMYVTYLENNGNIIGDPPVTSFNDIEEIWKLILEGDYKNVRMFVTSHIVDFSSIYSPFGNFVMEHIDKKLMLNFSILLGQYQYQSANQAVNQEINLNSFLASVIKLIHGTSK